MLYGARTTCINNVVCATVPNLGSLDAETTDSRDTSAGANTLEAVRLIE